MPHITSVLQSDEAIKLYQPALCCADLNNRCSNRQAPASPSPRLPPPSDLGLPFVLPLDCLAAARGPGLKLCGQGGLGCPAGNRFCGAGGRAGLITGDAGIRCSRGFRRTAGPVLAIAAPPAARRSRLALRPSAGLAWPPPVGRAVRACRDAVGAGWLARQAIICGGQEAGRA